MMMMIHLQLPATSSVICIFYSIPLNYIDNLHICQLLYQLLIWYAYVPNLYRQ